METEEKGRFEHNIFVKIFEEVNQTCVEIFCEKFYYNSLICVVTSHRNPFKGFSRNRR